MDYDPIKRSLGRFFNARTWTRRLFYRLLDVLLLRTWHIHRAIKAFGRNSNNNIQVLDAGSGFGQYVDFMARKYPKWHITAIDVKAEEVEACQTYFLKKGMNNVDFQVQDLVRYVLPDQYNLILSVDVMEHIEQDREVFFNFYKSLKKGGMLLISTPSDMGGSDVTKDTDHSFIGEHVRDGYSKSDLKEKLESAGFQRIKIDYTYGRPGSISWRLSMKYPITMLGRSKMFLVVLPFYYLITMPVILLLNLADVRTKHSKGTGLMARAWK